MHEGWTEKSLRVRMFTKRIEVCVPEGTSQDLGGATMVERDGIYAFGMETSE